MDKQTLIGDILAYLSAKNLTPHRFAKICDIDVASFYRFLKEPERTLQSDAIFRIWTAIYGTRKPKILRRAIPKPATASTQTTTKGDTYDPRLENLPF